jgi:Flp pilus assembly protein TadG
MFVMNGFGRRARKLSQGNSLIADSKGLRARIQPVEARIGTFLRSGEDGQALLEMWIVLPMLLILLTGVFTFGIAFINKMTLANAVGQAAVALQSSRANQTSDLDPCDIAFKTLSATANTLKPSQITMTITFNSLGANSGSPTSVTGSTCSGSWSTFQGTQTETNIVAATYPCNLAIYGRSFAAGCVLTAQVAEYQF